jgi:hypothetical protein
VMVSSSAGAKRDVEFLEYLSKSPAARKGARYALNIALSNPVCSGSIRIGAISFDLKPRDAQAAKPVGAPSLQNARAAKSASASIRGKKPTTSSKLKKCIWRFRGLTGRILQRKMKEAFLLWHGPFVKDKLRKMKDVLLGKVLGSDLAPSTEKVVIDDSPSPSRTAQSTTSATSKTPAPPGLLCSTSSDDAKWRGSFVKDTLGTVGSESASSTAKIVIDDSPSRTTRSMTSPTSTTPAPSGSSCSTPSKSNKAKKKKHQAGNICT